MRQTWVRSCGHRPTAPPQPDPETSATLPGEILRDYLEVWRKVRFSAPPEVRLQIVGDAREWRRTRGVLSLKAPGAETPWGAFTNFNLTARLEAARRPTTLPFGWIQLAAETAHTPWATAREVQLRFDCPYDDHDGSTVSPTVEFSARATQTRWGQAEAASGTATWTQSLTNPVPLRAQGKLRFQAATTPWASADEATLKGTFQQRFEAAPTDWGWWTNVAPFAAEWQLEATELVTQGVSAPYALCAGAWQPPRLTITDLFAEVHGGRVSASAKLDVATRDGMARVLADCDALKFQARLPAGLSNWLNRIRYEGRPDVFAEARGTLPPWTNPPATFGQEFLPTLMAEGTFRTGPGAYLGMEVSAAEGAITYSNRVLRIPRLHVMRPEGTADLQHVANPHTGEVYWNIRSSIDPNAARPVLGEGPGKGLDQVVFATPPEVNLELWLDGGNGGLTGLNGQVMMTNATVRGQPTTTLRVGVDYTNQVVQFFAPEVTFPQGVARADGARLELKPLRLTLTNAFSDADPARILGAIGDPALREILSDYRFDTPPTVRLAGVIPLGGGPGFDLRADVSGGPFHWWRITAPEISGEVHYTGQRLELRRMSGKFCEGKVDFAAQFDLLPGGAARYGFAARVSDASLRELVRALAQSTNDLSGRLDLRLNVTNAWTTNLNTWQGDGSMALRDGFLWEQPVFSVLSGFINALTPGLGSARFRSGAATVAITNGVFHSRDLVLDSALLQLKVRGSVDMEHRLDTVVQAKPLQTVGVLGPLINSLLWPVTKAFEFHATGTLEAPVVEPQHAPMKLFLAPLRPVQTFKDIFGVGPKEAPVYQPLDPTPPPKQP
jgi:hypothetical protein